MSPGDEFLELPLVLAPEVHEVEVDLLEHPVRSLPFQVDRVFIVASLEVE